MFVTHPHAIQSIDYIIIFPREGKKRKRGKDDNDRARNQPYDTTGRCRYFFNPVEAEFNPKEAFNTGLKVSKVPDIQMDTVYLH